MEGLQRSSSTFRRSGSSGLVWDERFLTEDAEAKKAAANGTEEAGQALDLRRSRSAGGVGMMMRRAAAGGGGDDKKLKVKKKQGQKEGEEQGDDQQVFRTKDVAPDLDPPSPRVSGCILCAIFRGSASASVPAAARRGRTKPRKKQR